MHRPLVVAAVLATVSGYVDAYVFLCVAEVFIANQSGNLIIAGMTMGGSDVRDLVLTATSLVAYTAGAAVAAALFHRPDRWQRRRLIDTSLTTLGVLAAATAILAISGHGVEPERRSPAIVIVVGACAMAMGAQATAVRRAGGIPVLVTAGTGAITSIGVELGRSRGRLEPAAREKAARMAAIIVTYVAGAALAALVVEHLVAGPLLLLAPCVVLAGIVGSQMLPSDREPPSDVPH